MVLPKCPFIAPVESVVKCLVSTIAVYVALLSSEHRRPASCLSRCCDNLINSIQERKGLLSRLTESSVNRGGKSRQQAGEAAGHTLATVSNREW